MTRFEVLRPHLENSVPLARAAEAAGVPIRTARRWLANFQQNGVAGLARMRRMDRGRRRLPDGLVRTVEGMVLTRPPPSAAAIHRRLQDLAPDRGWPVPAPRTVRAIVASLDPATLLVTLDTETSGCMWDIRYEFADGDVFEEFDVDVCRIDGESYILE